MYLKSIEVQGFKSFANKIIFEFHNGITGIVGPNGSGKSNVADAVRWVLGEQKVKQLRSASMQDVIFSGTETRKPQGFAYVAITLDNSDHQLAIDYDEVTVSRRIYRSGESEYLLNGSACRLKDINELSETLGLQDVVIIPVSATEGDNVTKKSPNMPWYTGKALLEHLETVDVSEAENVSEFYLPVQRVSRPNHEFRGFQGQIESGRVHVGDIITTLPSNETAAVKTILVGSDDREEAVAGQAVTIQLDKEVDVSRGCVLTNNNEIPVAKGFEATLLWMDDSRLEVGKEYLVKVGTKKIAGVVKSIEFKTDVNTGEHLHADTIEKNEIALCKIGLSDKVVLDEFKRNKTLGELILIDRVSHMTSACGVVESVDTEGEKPYFQKDDVKVGGYVFEEFYFNLENALLSKADKEVKTYHVGDVVPVEGDSFEYPGYFDIVSLEDSAAVLIRDKRVQDIIPLDEYVFMGLPVVDERGFALEIRSNDDYQMFLREFEAADNKSEFHNKWFKFETYRRIVCTDNFWMI